jgi:hypothetical protein
MQTYQLVVIANGIASNPVTFDPYPILSSSLTPAAICSGSNFTYTPTSVTNGATFTWTRAAVAGISNAAITIPQSVNPNETLINTTTNPVSVVYAYAITANNCTINQNVTVVVDPKPSLSISGSTNICINNSTTLTANGANTYSWSNNATTNAITVNPTTTTTYSVTGTNTFGCTNTDTVTVTVNLCTGIAANEGSNDVTIFPNPFSEKIVLKMNMAGEAEVVLFNVLGEEKGKWRISNETNEFDTHSLASGIYFLRITTADGSYTKKVLKE